MHANTKLSSKEVVKCFKVGSIVRSEFYENDSHVLRVITKIEENADTGSGRRIWASDGELCSCCKRPLSKPINGVDGSWFLPA